MKVTSITISVEIEEGSFLKEELQDLQKKGFQVGLSSLDDPKPKIIAAIRSDSCEAIMTALEEIKKISE